MALLDVKNLTKRFRGLDAPAVDKFSLQLEKGDIYGFIGPNGAGKTTTIKMLLNLVAPDSGSGTIFGLDIVKESVEIRRQIGFMSGEVHLYNYMRGHELLRFVTSLHSDIDSVLTDQLCRRFDVPLERKIKTYSAGQKQMLAIILALSHKSGLLVLDEPTKGLDPSKKNDFLEMIKKRGNGGCSVIISSHVLSDIESICTRIGFIRKGIMLDEEVVSKARKEMGKIIIVSFDEEVQEKQLQFEGITSIRRDGSEYILHFASNGRKILRQLSDLPVSGLRYGSASLNDLYRNLYRNDDDS